MPIIPCKLCAFMVERTGTTFTAYHCHAEPVKQSALEGYEPNWPQIPGNPLTDLTKGCGKGELMEGPLHVGYELNDTRTGRLPSDSPVPGARPSEDKQYQAMTALREWRQNCARQEEVPPYIVLTNQLIHDIVKFWPTHKDQLTEIKGFGLSRAERWGDGVLEVLRNVALA